MLSSITSLRRNMFGRRRHNNIIPALPALRSFWGDYACYVSGCSLWYFVGSAIFVYLALWEVEELTWTDDGKYHDWDYEERLYKVLSITGSTSYLICNILSLSWYVGIKRKRFYLLDQNASRAQLAGTVTFLIASVLEFLDTTGILQAKSIFWVLYTHFCFVAGLFYMYNLLDTYKSTSTSTAATATTTTISSSSSPPPSLLLLLIKFESIGDCFFFIGSSIDVIAYYLAKYDKISSLTVAWSYVIAYVLWLGDSLLSILSDVYDDDDDEEEAAAEEEEEAENEDESSKKNKKKKDKQQIDKDKKEN